MLRQGTRRHRFWNAASECEVSVRAVKRWLFCGRPVKVGGITSTWRWTTRSMSGKNGWVGEPRAAAAVQSFLPGEVSHILTRVDEGYGITPLTQIGADSPVLILGGPFSQALSMTPVAMGHN